jgi:hypothetical protein
MPYVTTPAGQKPAPTAKPDEKSKPQPATPKPVFSDWAMI